MTYTCPMHPEINQHKPGKCPLCGMKLVPENEVHAHSHHHDTHHAKDDYTPLIVIICLITVVVLALAVQDSVLQRFNWQAVMMNFMAGFFIVFSGFKLLDLKGFVEGYSTYDLLAQRVPAYGYLYPFIELALGIMYALHINSTAVNLFVFFLLTFSGIGVALKIAKKESFQCACLGTFLKVPLTKVTLIEDFGMALMALWMVLL